MPAIGFSLGLLTVAVEFVRAKFSRTLDGLMTGGLTDLIFVQFLLSRQSFSDSYNPILGVRCDTALRVSAPVGTA